MAKYFRESGLGVTKEQLLKKGFVNVCEYQGGIQDYRKHIPQDK